MLAHETSSASAFGIVPYYKNGKLLIAEHDNLIACKNDIFLNYILLQLARPLL